MSKVFTVFHVRIHPHPSKRKAGITNETVKIPGYGQQSARLVDEHYKENGQRATKVLAGFEIDDKFVEVDLSGPYDNKTTKK